jgi:hypothetical protein
MRNLGRLSFKGCKKVFVFFVTFIDSLKLEQTSYKMGVNDTQTGVLLGIPRSAICVQRFDDSRNSAIHITYRGSRRSSSVSEPRDPLLKVV